MSKTYLCKNCEHNNNGWCNKLKKQGLKTITECEFLSLKEDTTLKVDNSLNDTSNTDECDFFGNTEDDIAHRVYGKREMFYHLSRQVLGMEEQGLTNISIKELKELFVNLHQSLLMDEKIFGIKTTCETDEFIVNNSKELINKWIDELKCK